MKGDGSGAVLLTRIAVVSLSERSFLMYSNMRMKQHVGTVELPGVSDYRVLHLTRGSDRYFCPGAPTLCPDGFHLLYDVHAFQNLSKHNVFTVQPGGNNGRNEELGLCEWIDRVLPEGRPTCDPLVFAPEFAIDKSPGWLCLNLKFSSTEAVEGGQKRRMNSDVVPGNASPNMDFPPVPL